MTKAMRVAGLVRGRTILFSCHRSACQIPMRALASFPDLNFRPSNFNSCFGKTLSISEESSQCMNSNNPLAVEPETENDIAR